jgi:prolyl-tRNA synthetase
MLKTLVFAVSVGAQAEAGSDEADGQYTCIAVVRGDHEINEEKIRGKVSSLHGEPAKLSLMDDDEASKRGFCLGFVGPQALRQMDAGSTCLLIDHDAANGGFWVTGANKTDYHVRHFNWNRDLDPSSLDGRVHIDDIRNAIDGDPAPDGGVLKASKGIEVGQVFKLGTKYTEALGVGVLDEGNRRQPVIMGCYGIGANRILAAAIERDGGHDEHGMIWPARIAPYKVIITPIRFEGRAAEVTQRVADELAAQGRDVLIDDRDQRPGVKFTDADLIGIPLRITIGEKGLKEDQVELKPRRHDRSESVNVAQAATRAVDLLKDL